MDKHFRFYALSLVLAVLVFTFLAALLDKNTRFTFSSQTQPVALDAGKGKKIISNKILCRELPEYYMHEDMKLTTTTVNDVEAMLMFIAFPRSGHTLIGSLLDAHPNMVIANEYDILSNWEKYTPKQRNRQYLFEQLYTNSYLEANEGDRSSKNCLPRTKYHYLVPNQWQGKFDGMIKIIGDKKGGTTARLLARSTKHASFLQEIRQVVKVPVKILHVIRNPFDNIATVILRGRFGYNLNWTNVYKTPVKIPQNKLIKTVEDHTSTETTIAQLKRQLGDQIHTVKSEDVIANPELEMHKICRFLNIHCSKKYISDCVSIVYRTISRSRDGIIWNKEAKDLVFRFIKRFPYYNSYKFEQ